MAQFNFNHPGFEAEDDSVRYFVADTLTVLLTVVAARATFQLCQIGLYPRTGQIFAQSPYFVSSDGLVGSCTVQVDESGASKIELSESGLTTSHSVKYSHPVDGSAHFSQDGRVVTSIRRQSIRLDSEYGHLFEFHALGLPGFRTLEPGQERAGRLYLPFVVAEATDAATVTAEWWPKEEIERIARERSEIVGPITELPRRLDGQPFKACLVAHPMESLRSRAFLVINVHPTSMPPNLTEPALILFGGWDADQKKRIRPGDQIGFLAFTYPCRNIEELRSRIGTVDYTAGTP